MSSTSCLDVGGNYAINASLSKLSWHIGYIKGGKIKSSELEICIWGSSLLPIKYRKMIPNALVLPHFDYLDTIYCNTSKTKLHKNISFLFFYKKV